jgi:CHAT domain-containing protein
LETLRGNVRGQELKLSFIRNRLEVYELLVDACLRNASEASLAEAFGYIEEAKSRILLDQMVRPTSMNQSTAVLREGNLRDELNSYYSLIELEQLRAGRRSARLQRLQAKARAHESELVRALHEIGAGESACTRDKSHDVTLQKTRDTMPRDAVILEYFQTGDRIVACVLSRESLRIVPVTLASRIGRVLRLLHFQLSKLRFGPEYTDTFRDALLHSTQRHLESLYRELLANIRDQLNASHLVIVPHGTLHYVPFHALFDGRRYVIDDHTVSYAPSATIYSVCLTNSVNTSGPTLLMGVPDEKAPLIKNEIQCLQAFMPSAMAYLGASATERVLKSEGPSSRIVHIATHGCFRHDNPMFSSIRLGDSYLSLYDLYHLRLPAELVTLSGCATGLNAIAAGDELIGLARGLFQAGARSLLLSLWEAHDVTTAQFMKTFYGRLCDGADRASAARDAMLEVRNDYPHPYQWAPFVLMGGHGPLER